MASTYLTRTPSASNRKTFTLSFWIKRHKLSSGTQTFLEAYTNTADLDLFYFDPNDNINFVGYPSGVITYQLEPSMKFRDSSAWYHVVFSVDTTQATASDRMKIYINGVLQTSFITETYPSLNQDTLINSTKTHYIGYYDGTSYLDASLAHFHFIDGTAYDASYFGETDTASGIWKPKTSPSVTYGTNGYFLKFANSGSLGTDSSGNGNNFTVNGSGTQTLDTPSNVFATLNALDNITSSTFSNGNNTIVTSGGNYGFNTSTLGVTQGKWYWEIKVDSTSTEDLIGIAGRTSQATNNYLGANGDTYGYNDNGNYYNDGSQTAYGNSYTTGDIISVAMDLDNNKLYFAKNGTWQNSGDPTSGATGTGAISIVAASTTKAGVFFAGVGEFEGTQSGTFSSNFGNGYFGTTAVSSGNADGAGYGIFEYAPPTGYYALCTRNINTYG